MFLVGVQAKDNWDTQWGTRPTAGLIDLCLNSPNSLLSLSGLSAHLAHAVAWQCCKCAFSPLCFHVCWLATEVQQIKPTWPSKRNVRVPGAGETLHPYLPNLLLPPPCLLKRSVHLHKAFAYASSSGCNLAPSGCCCRQDHNQ
jgi:hypothetical protein